MSPTGLPSMLCEQNARALIVRTRPNWARCRMASRSVVGRGTPFGDAELLQAVDGMVDREGRSPSRRRGLVVRCGRLVAGGTGERSLGRSQRSGGGADR